MVLDSNLIIYGQRTWCVLDLRGKLVKTNYFAGDGEIHNIRMLETLDSYSMISWTGDLADPRMVLETFKEDKPVGALEGHSVITFNEKQTMAFLCDTPDSNSVVMYTIEEGAWARSRQFEENKENILMLELSKNEQWCCATILNGFKLWHVSEERVQRLVLPNGVRNITKKFNTSSNIILSKGDKLAVTGIRQELLVWDMETGDLVKRMTAHFQRIVDVKSLVVGTNNEIITSSIDRCIKIWNLDYIFEKERHIDKHELTIDSLSISTTAGIAVVVTRSCLGVWDFMTGHLLFKLNNSALGAIITHGLVNEDGTYTVAAESGDVLYWDMKTRKVIFQEKQPNIQQIFFYKNQTRCIVISREGDKGSYEGLVISRSFPEGKVHWKFSYPFSIFKNIVLTPDELNLVCYNGDNSKPTIYVHSSKNGSNTYTIPVKYNGFKEVSKLVALPDKPSVVALIDVDKGNQIDIVQQKHIRFLKKLFALPLDT